MDAWEYREMQRIFGEACPSKEAVQAREQYEKLKGSVKYQARKRKTLQAWRLANKDRVKAWAKPYMREYKKRPHVKEKRKTYRESPKRRASRNLRKRAKELLRSGGHNYDGLTGCTSAVLTRWIQGKFEKGMTWENYGAVWHIDHVIPLARFDLTKEYQRRVAFHFTNLQPLFAQDNLYKSDDFQPQTAPLPLVFSN